MTTIQQAIEEIQSGNISGYNFIYQKFKNFLFKLGVDSNLPYGDAEDLMNATFYKLPKDILKFEYQNDNAFRSWLVTIHLNRIRSYFRNKKLDYTNLADYEWEQLEVENDESGEDRRLHIIKEEIESLPEKDRILLTMRAKEIPYKTISDILKIQPNTLKVQYLRISKKLEFELKDKFKKLGLL